MLNKHRISRAMEYIEKTPSYGIYVDPLLGTTLSSGLCETQKDGKIMVLHMKISGKIIFNTADYKTLF